MSDKNLSSYDRAYKMVYGLSPNQDTPSNNASSSHRNNPLTGRPFESIEEVQAYGQYISEVSDLKHALETANRKSKIRISVLLVLLFLSLVTNCVLAFYLVS